MKIDFNSDLAEGAANDEAIMQLISSANICCALHAGSSAILFKSLKLAKRYGLRVGAHPSYDDRANFGRSNITLNEEDLTALLHYQLGAFSELCKQAGVQMSYIKPHGALYNMACVDLELARKIAKIAENYGAKLMGLSNSALITACDELGVESISEVFADRRYTDEGLLVSRTNSNALISDESEAIAQVLNMIKHSFVTSINGKKVPLKAQSLCVHGDGAKALEFVQKIRAALKRENIQIRS